MRAGHEAELAKLVKDYEERLENQRVSMDTDMASRVKGQLMGLAGYGS